MSIISRILFFVTFFCSSYSFAQSIYLINDSPFQLTAEVQAADGTSLGQVSLQPKEKHPWSTEESRLQLNLPSSPEYSMTPFIVIWRCSYGGFFSMCTNVAPGQTVIATQCPGNLYCRPKPKPQNQQTNQPENQQEEDGSE